MPNLHEKCSVYALFHWWNFSSLIERNNEFYMKEMHNIKKEMHNIKNEMHNIKNEIQFNN